MRGRLGPFLTSVVLAGALLSKAWAGSSLIVSWSPNTEPDLKGYKVYFGTASRSYGPPVDVRLDTTYAVVNLTEGVTYYFAVTAYDTAGNESDYSVEVSGIAPDRTAPQLTTVQAVSLTGVDVTFSEPVEKTSAEDKANYSIDKGITVLAATLDGNGTVVHLTTTAHQEGQTYTLRVSNVRDVADVPNTIAANSSLSYTTPVSTSDTTPPQLVSIAVVSLSQIDVRFSEALEQASAETAGNYTIDSGVSVLQAALDGSSVLVHLTTTAHTPGQNYTLRVSHIRDRAPTPNTIAANSALSYTVPLNNTDTTPPQLTSLTVISLTQIDVRFSEAVEEASAETVSNYGIDGGVTVTQATLDGNAVVVHLTTTTHTAGQSYTLRVSNVRDRAPTPNTIAANSFLSYTVPLNNVDTTPPRLASVAVVSPTQIDVRFSEAVEETSAEMVGNYSIDHGISVLQAVLDGSLVVVHLTTTSHASGQTYTLRVSDVRDRAVPANVIASNSSYAYTVAFGGATSDDVTPPQISAVNVLTLTNIDVVFSEAVDQASAEAVANYRIDGVIVLVAALDGNPSIVHLTTTPHERGRSYTITISGISDRATPANTIASNSRFAYTVAPDAASDSGTPIAYVLYPTYPNPFNPWTTVRFELLKENKVTVRIYNIVGTPVRTLVDLILPAGRHEYLWDATDDQHRSVPSGVYLCRLVISEVVASGKLELPVKIFSEIQRMTYLK